jgi:hypothetical protein
VVEHLADFLTLNTVGHDPLRARLGARQQVGPAEGPADELGTGAGSWFPLSQ